MSNSREPQKDRVVELQLQTVLKKLKATATGLQKSQGYTEETEKVRFLYELIKEQVKNEDSSHPVS